MFEQHVINKEAYDQGRAIANGVAWTIGPMCLFELWAWSAIEAHKAWVRGLDGMFVHMGAADLYSEALGVTGTFCDPASYQAVEVGE